MKRIVVIMKPPTKKTITPQTKEFNNPRKAINFSRMIQSINKLQCS